MRATDHDNLLAIFAGTHEAEAAMAAGAACMVSLRRVSVPVMNGADASALLPNHFCLERISGGNRRTIAKNG